MIDFLPHLFTSTSGSVVGAVLLVVYAAITSLRKRRDLTIAELEKRVLALEAEMEKIKQQHIAEIQEKVREVEVAEIRVDGYKLTTLQQSRDLYALRRELAAHGLPDPTNPTQASG